MDRSLTQNDDFAQSIAQRSTAEPSTRQRESTVPPAALERLALGAGIVFNGGRPWDIQVHDASVYRRILRHGSLGLGEAYMDGLWDAERLDETSPA